MAKFITLPNKEIVNLDVVFRVVRHTNYIKITSTAGIISSVKLDDEYEALTYFNYLEKILTY